MSLRSWLIACWMGLLVLVNLPVGAQTVPAAQALRWARSADASTLDPHAGNVGPNISLLHQIYEPLILRMPDGSLSGALATRWEMTADPAVWELAIRPDVRFHDGTLLSADDVVFSLNRARTPGSPWQALLSGVVDVRKIGPLAVQVRLNGPNLVFPASLTNLFIMNEAWARQHGAERPQDLAAKAENFATHHANGTGPYTLERREPDVRTTLKAFPGYWGLQGQPLPVGRLEFVPIKSQASRLAALMSGEIDIVQDVSPQDVLRLKANPAVRVTEGAENRSIFLGLNVGAASLKTSNVQGRNPLADRRVREAFALAIDREQLRRAVMHGLAIPAGMIAPPFVEGYSKELDAVPLPDPARARRLLAEAGYPEGFELGLQCPNDRYVSDEAICTAVAGFLAKIGVKARVMARPFAVHSPAIFAAELDFFLYGWGVPTYDSAYIFDYLVHTRGKNGRGSANATGFSDPALDARIASLSSESDAARRQETVAQIWQAVQREGIYIPLHNQVVNYAMRPELDVPVSSENTIFFKWVRPQRKAPN